MSKPRTCVVQTWLGHLCRLVLDTWFGGGGFVVALGLVCSQGRGDQVESVALLDLAEPLDDSVWLRTCLGCIASDMDLLGQAQVSLNLHSRRSMWGVR